MFNLLVPLLVEADQELVAEAVILVKHARIEAEGVPAITSILVQDVVPA